MTAISYWKSLL